MKLLLTDDALVARAAVARGELASPARGLRDDLERVETHGLYVPRVKALLSRAGGRCERDGTTLEFEPFSPHHHRCPTCGTVHVGELHDRFWVFWYQLWLAERAVQGAVLGRLLGDPRALALAATILERYSDQYLLYPNRDNVLGPTRVFFSTYLESIWLLNLCIALDVLEANGEWMALGARVRERILEPSAALIASYDEGASNRQVWNDAALLAAARLLGRDADAESATFGSSGVAYHCQHGLLADGTWYEGENYHLFAHRGLWYGVAMAERAGLVLPREAIRRFQEGFATPFLTALPDMTLPSRRDSQYAISLRQPRFAELCELGLAREHGAGDPRLRAMLGHLYGDPYPRRDTGRANTTADVERNLPGTSLSRADLGWRSLLFARPQLPTLDGQPLGSVLLEGQGVAIFRRQRERVYVALDYGTSGGGHGHPDRLNVLLYDGDTRWLDDMGTGSYVDSTLHWYRSTLAHNAPMFDGKDQERVDGRLVAFEEHGEIGWISAEARDLYPGVVTHRTLVVLQDYVVDELTWDSESAVRMELPLHIEPAEVWVEDESSSASDMAPSSASDILPNTFGVRELSSRPLGAGCVARLVARDRDRELRGYLVVSSESRLIRASAPGAPGRGRRDFLVLAASRSSGRQWVRIVWSWAGRVGGIRTDAEGLSLIVERADGEDRHVATLGGWRLARRRGSVEEVIALDGMRRDVVVQRSPSRAPTGEAQVIEVDHPVTFLLGEENYRRSEESWTDAGRPTADVSVMLTGGDLRIDVTVRGRTDPFFVPTGAVNPYDNEQPDINGDGVQLYLADALGASAWVLVPESNPAATLRVRAIDGWPTPRKLDGRWRPVADGYQVSIRLPRPVVDSETGRFALGLVVNEKPRGRERRRGQLVLGGGSGEFVYLRGDREDRDRLPSFVVLS